MELMQAYLLMDDPEAAELMGVEVTVETVVEAAKMLALHPTQLHVAPGRVARNVEHVLLTYADVEEDWS
jgi:hypothetical protein